jgi:hypothetical protein
MMSEEGSFAHFTVTQRMPGIVRRVIAENDFSPTIVENLENLIRELPNGIARLLQDDPAPDLTKISSATSPLPLQLCALSSQKLPQVFT